MERGNYQGREVGGGGGQDVGKGKGRGEED